MSHRTPHFMDCRAGGKSRDRATEMIAQFPQPPAKKTTPATQRNAFDLTLQRQIDRKPRV